MIQFLFFLSVLRYTALINPSQDGNYVHYFNEIVFGFKKGSQFFINISNISFTSYSFQKKIAFGLATKKEMKKIDSVASCIEYFQNQKKYSQVQFITEGNTVFNFTIPSKNVLTPYSISCSSPYYYYFNIEILNGKNHFDYRYENCMILTLVFTILFFIITFSCLVIYIITIRYTQFYIDIFLILFFITISVKSLLIYFLFSKNKNSSFLTIKIIRNWELVDLLVWSFGYLFLVIYYHYRFKLQDFTNTRLHKLLKFLLVISVFFEFILVLTQLSTKSAFASLTVSVIFYLFVMSIGFVFPFKMSLSKIAFFLYLFAGFFTHVLRLYYLLDFSYQISPNEIISTIFYITEIVWFVVIILFAIDYGMNSVSGYHKKISNWKSNEELMNI